jgi:putrescine aminotransferase
MLEGFEWIKEQNDNVSDVRALGLLGAISLERTSEPIGPKIVAAALERGLICRSVVYDGQDTLAFAPPFPITKEEMEEMIQIVNESIKAVK